MNATLVELTRWFERGVADGYQRMIVWCGIFDYEDYPEYSDRTGDLLHQYINYNSGKNMKSLMEIYDLTLDMESQMAERRAFHY